MLRAVFQAANLAADQAVDVQEDRGSVKVCVSRTASLEELTEGLNAEINKFLAQGGWFQLWKGEVVSANSPESPVRAKYVLDDLEPGQIVKIRERRGLITVHISRDTNAEEFAQAMNPANEEFFAGAQWFQLWQGEIVTIDSSDHPHGGGDSAGVHRGPVVHETP